VAAVVVICRVSVPSPPVRTSPPFSVFVVEVTTALKVSLRAVPVKAAPVSTPVVRGLVAVAAKEFKINELGC
jgi:hypothetical protein